jgi:hypothetical protein
LQKEEEKKKCRTVNHSSQLFGNYWPKGKKAKGKNGAKQEISD